MTARCVIPLPTGFRAGDTYAFHRRDRESLAEQVHEASGRLAKGLVWQGSPACLVLHFHPEGVAAELQVDGGHGETDASALPVLVRRMLGLDQDVAGFEQAHRHHPELGPLIARTPGLRVPLAATPFEALTWAVTSQQISVQAALTLRRRLILTAGLRHSSGLACHPDATTLAALGVETLRRAGFSRAKAQTLLEVSRRVLDGTLPLEEGLQGTRAMTDLGKRLLAIRGIGRWTVNYTLLRGYGWLDASLHGDAGVRRGIQLLLGRAERISEEAARQWLAPFSPWRALVAAHLWALDAMRASSP